MAVTVTISRAGLNPNTKVQIPQSRVEASWGLTYGVGNISKPYFSFLSLCHDGMMLFRMYEICR